MPTFETLLADAARLPVPDRIQLFDAIWDTLPVDALPPLSDEWVRLPNNGPLYRGRRPLDAMIEGGIPMMIEVRRHVDALRGGL